MKTFTTRVKSETLKNEEKLQKIIDFIERNRSKESGLFHCPLDDYCFGWSCGGEESDVLFGYLKHLLWQIRVKGSKSHMDIFIELFGEDESIRRFEIWLTESIRTTENLRLKLQELKNKRLNEFVKNTLNEKEKGQWKR